MRSRWPLAPYNPNPSPNPSPNPNPHSNPNPNQVVTFAMSAHGFTPAFARAHLLDDGGLLPLPLTLPLTLPLPLPLTLPQTLTLTLTLTLTRWAEAQATRRCGGADLRVHRRESAARGQAGHVGALRRARDRGEGRARGQGLWALGSGLGAMG